MRNQPKPASRFYAFNRPLSGGVNIFPEQYTGAVCGRSSPRSLASVPEPVSLPVPPANRPRLVTVMVFAGWPIEPQPSKAAAHCLTIGRRDVVHRKIERQNAGSRVRKVNLGRNGSFECSGMNWRFCGSVSALIVGGQGRNRTADASLFRAALYRLSYLAIGGIFSLPNAAMEEACSCRSGRPPLSSLPAPVFPTHSRRHSPPIRGGCARVNPWSRSRQNRSL